MKITGDLLIKLHYRNDAPQVTEATIKNFIGGYNIDYVKIVSRSIWNGTVKIKLLIVTYMFFILFTNVASWGMSFVRREYYARSHRRFRNSNAGGEMMAACDLHYHRECDLVSFCRGQKFKTVRADPPWQFQNRTGKMAPEHKRLNRYPAMKLEEIKAIPVDKVGEPAMYSINWNFRYERRA